MQWRTRTCKDIQALKMPQGEEEGEGRGVREGGEERARGGGVEERAAGGDVQEKAAGGG